MSLRASLEAYWKLDESSDGTGAVTRVDSMGSNDLTDNNTTPSGTGKISNGIDCEDGNSEFLDITDNASLSTGDIDFSVSAWVNRESSGLGAIVGKGSEAASTNEWALYNKGTDVPTFTLSVDGVGLTVTVDWGSSINDATWYHIVGYHDAAANTIGIIVNDGTPVTTATGGSAPTDRAGPFGIGFQNGLVNWDGIIDEVGFWKKVLSAAEITRLYNSGNGLAYPFIVSQAVGGAISFSGALAKHTNKVVAGSITNTGALAKLTKLDSGFTGAISFSGALAKRTNKVTAGAFTSSGALTRQTNKVVAGAITFTGGLRTMIRKVVYFILDVQLDADGHVIISPTNEEE